jgi:hypothetical protein
MIGLMADSPQPWGKLLYDSISARLAVQSADHAVLTSRSKDLLGAATIASTITGSLPACSSEVRQSPKNYVSEAMKKTLVLRGSSGYL